MPDLAVVVPTRGRPDNIRRLVDAWTETNAWEVATLVLAVDADDPKYPAYDRLHYRREEDFALVVHETWAPMVDKLNKTALAVARSQGIFADQGYSAVGFAGDDHVPVTRDWAQRYVTELRKLGTGMVHGDDGFQGASLASEWAVTCDAVRELGAMVPVPVEHMYCDNAMMDLYGAAGMMRYLPDVQIEHRHPLAGKASLDKQYVRVNSSEQYARDSATYEAWKAGALADQVALLKALRAG
jgi:hypothetical protein